jgi:flagellar basal-body rod modification protein FlgD
MSAAAISGASSAVESSSISNSYADLSSDEFMKILLSELTNQDPLEPTDSGAVLEQLSSIRSIESQVKLQDSLEALVTQNAISSSANMIGKIIAGLDSNNETVTGLVISVRVQDGQPILQLDDGTAIPADRVTEIVDPAIFDDGSEDDTESAE